jgi:hypothetical protein
MIQRRDLMAEVVVALEKGVNRQLNNSFLYSPFRFFFRRFERNNVQTMSAVRDVVKNDISILFNDIKGFNISYFIQDGVITDGGKELLTKSFNIGIHLIKKKLGVRGAFKVLTNSSFRDQIYEFVLTSLRMSCANMLPKNIH